MSWTYLYKTNPVTGILGPTNMLYSPLMSIDGKLLKMNYQYDGNYHKKEQPKELIDYFFHKEVNNLMYFKNYSWCPKVYDVDNNSIVIEFNKHYVDENVDFAQVEQIVTDIFNEGYYKVNLYPHCFFEIDGVVKPIDFYGVMKKDETINREFLKSLVGTDSKERFDVSTTNIGNLDFGKFFEYTMKTQLGMTWTKSNPFPDMYERIINVVKD